LITAEKRDVEEGIRAIPRGVVSVGGTISGEHGIGMDKKRFLPIELSYESILLQQKIKHLFDPP
jgi:FAD/FMN-containing dehydrogenase